MRVVLLGQAIIHQAIDWSTEIRAITRDADAVLCNFEGCLPPPGVWPMKSKTVHPAHPDALAMLAELGVTHLAIANNHVWDFGHAGVIETRRMAEAAGFAVAGAGRDEGEARGAAIRGGVALVAVDAGPTPDWAIAGRGPGVAAVRVRKALGLPAADIERIEAISADCGDAARRAWREAVGYDRPAEAARPLGLNIEAAEGRCELYRPDPDDLARLSASVAAARARATFVVAAVHYHHWSGDLRAAPGWLDDICAAAADAGADAIMGSGPPWALPTGRKGRAFVAPGLGNLAFHTRRPGEYDRLGLPVWTGQAAIFDDGRWGVEAFGAARPA